MCSSLQDTQMGNVLKDMLGWSVLVMCNITTKHQNSLSMP